MSRCSEEWGDIGKLKQNVRDLLEKVFSEQDKEILRAEQEKEGYILLYEEVYAQEEEFQKKFEQSETQKKELQKKLEQTEALNKELQKKLEQIEAQKKEIQKDREQIEAQKKELQKKLEKSEVKKKELGQREMQLKQMHEKAILENRKAGEMVLEEKKENVELRTKVIGLEKLLYPNKDQAAVKAVKQVHICTDDDSKLKQKMMDTIREVSKQKKKELKFAEAEAELHRARQELIYGWDSTSRAFIGIKRVGELDSKPFQIACKRKYPMDEADDQAATLCSLWENYVRDPSWKPFKTSETFRKETYIEEDEKLKVLRDGFGIEVYNAVTTALLELNEYNPNSRCSKPELWNFKVGRRATLTEGISYLQKQLKLQKRRKSS